MAIADRIEYVRLEQLLLDPENPRLPSSLEDRSQDAMLQYIEKTYEPILIGRSIARHGFFVSEPLIVIPRADDKTFTVVEGNRRLVALKLLTDVQARELVGRRRREWERLADQADIPARGVPVIKVASHDEVAPIIGYRHIAGIAQDAAGSTGSSAGRRPTFPSSPCGPRGSWSSSLSSSPSTDRRYDRRFAPTRDTEVIG